MGSGFDIDRIWLAIYFTQQVLAVLGFDLIHKISRQVFQVQALAECLLLLHGRLVWCMDEGTLKTPIP
jgi:hypothetical protein